MAQASRPELWMSIGIEVPELHKAKKNNGNFQIVNSKIVPVYKICTYVSNVKVSGMRFADFWRWEI